MGKFSYFGIDGSNRSEPDLGSNRKLKELFVKSNNGTIEKYAYEALNELVECIRNNNYILLPYSRSDMGYGSLWDKSLGRDAGRVYYNLIPGSDGPLFALFTDFDAIGNQPVDVMVTRLKPVLKDFLNCPYTDTLLFNPGRNVFVVNKYHIKLALQYSEE